MSEQLELFDQPVPNIIEVLTFNQAMRLFKYIHWSKTKMGPRTDALTGHMVSFFDGRLFHTIGRQDVVGLRYALEKRGLGLSSVNKAHRILKLMCNKFEAWKSDGWANGFDFQHVELPRKNPANFVRVPKDPARDRFLTPWEFRIIIRLARRLNDWALADIIRGGVWWRLSPIDLINLNDDEISDDPFQIELRRRHTITPNNPQGELQIVPLTEKAWALIERNRRYRNPGERRIFNTKNLRRRINKVRKLYVLEGGRDFTMLDLRKAGPGQLHEKGETIESIADGLGHSTPKTTRNHYVPQTRPHLRRHAEILEEAFK